MDGHSACHKYNATTASLFAGCGRVWARDEASSVNLGRTAPSVDLGGSSKYSNESFDGRSGEGFHDNST